jgi:uncharacterized membrane protein YcaP (DUF421 family)
MLFVRGDGVILVRTITCWIFFLLLIADVAGLATFADMTSVDTILPPFAPAVLLSVLFVSLKYLAREMERLKSVF